MQIVIHATARRASDAAARFVADCIAEAPQLVLGLPTGRTPIPLYAALALEHRRGRADFSGVTTFNLDEFVGLAPSDRRSYAAFMRRHLFSRVNLHPARTFLPRGDATDLEREADRYEAAICAAGGLDLAVLGIGDNGHIGFNEPAGSLEAVTHVVRLHARSRAANAGAFGGDASKVPGRAISMGIATMLSARHVMLIATGAAKARIVRRALEGPVTTRVPASLVQTHPRCVVVLDRAAASELRSPRPRR
jgi:glucosamine-6-phosphate deaminase